jgi:hypothetical protein
MVSVPSQALCVLRVPTRGSFVYIKEARFSAFSGFVCSARAKVAKPIVLEVLFPFQCLLRLCVFCEEDAIRSGRVEVGSVSVPSQALCVLRAPS